MRTISLPRRLLVTSAAIGLLTPFLARMPGVFFHGIDWLTGYLPGIRGVLFISVFNLLPAAVLYALGRMSRGRPVAYWFAVAGLLAFLLWAHGTLNLRSSSTAVVGLLFIPIYAVGVVVAGWSIGWIADALTKHDRLRFWVAGSAVVASIGAGFSTSVSQLAATREREARFPAVSVQEIALVKREVLRCCAIGGVEFLALDDFDSKAGNDIAVLGVTGLALLEPASYSAKSQAPFEHQDCDGCVHMYPYLVPDGKGGVLVATSDGLSDSRGRLLWANKATGFSRTVPLQAQQGAPTFLAYHRLERVDLHSLDGKILWSVELPVEDVGVYVSADGQEMASAIAVHQGSRQLLVYDAAGNIARAIPLPKWALNVKAIAWPRPGNLLVGGGNLIGVLDSNGREVLRHVIQGTSFDPYHGPDGVGVRFRAGEAPYLSVASHGSSGYARSVLLVFDSKGHLVWQEETNKLGAIIAVPSPTGRGEVILAGGMDGIVEYGLAGEASPGLVAPSGRVQE